MRTLLICMGILLSSCTEMMVQTNDTDPVLVVCDRLQPKPATRPSK